MSVRVCAATGGSATNEHTVNVDSGVSQAPRFTTTAPARVPGPGEYDPLQPLGKKTYNVAIVEEEQRARHVA